MTQRCSTRREGCESSRRERGSRAPLGCMSRSSERSCEEILLAFDKLFYFKCAAHFRPAPHPVPATMPPPCCPLQLQEYFPPPCCWQLNCPCPSVHHCHGEFWRVERLVTPASPRPLGAAIALGRRARAEVTIAVNDTMMLVVVDADFLYMFRSIRAINTALYNRKVYTAKPQSRH